MTPATRTLSSRAFDVLLNAGLQAHRNGQLHEGLGPRHPRLAAWLQRRWLQPVLGTLGDAVPPTQRRLFALRCVLVWALSQLRPDRQPGLADIPAQAWLQSTSWRPLLALASHHGFLAVPAFPSHYRRRENETAVDNLCGLWSVVPSTLYRYMDKGRQQLGAALLQREPPGEWLLSLRQAAWRALSEQPVATPTPGRPWHLAQAEQAMAEARATDALWHSLSADDPALVLQVFRRHSLALAATEEADAMVDSWELPRRDRRVAFEVALDMATLWRHRHDLLRENDCLQQALRIADATGLALLCGRAFAALGRFHMARDHDRTLACYDDALRHLRVAAGGPTDDPDTERAREELVRSLVHLAWIHLRCSDPKSLPLLEQVDELDRDHPLPDEIRAEVEQVWGEYWRCAGQLQKALAHKQRALNIYERLGDQRSALSTCNNLSLIYAEARDIGRAIHYGQRVLDAARDTTLEPEVLAGAQLHVGIAHFYKAQYDLAIQHYDAAMQVYERGGISGRLSVCHFNLAEAYFHRYARDQNPEDERLGDHHAGIALRLGQLDQRQGWAETVGALKSNALGSDNLPDRLLPDEFADHYQEMNAVRQQRRRLAMPDLPPVEQVRARLQIARAYLAIAVRERESALALAHTHGRPEDMDEALDSLRDVFERALSQEELRRAHWEAQAADLLDRARCAKVLAHLAQHGALQKRHYAAISGLGLATASKHLVALAGRGLLVQIGKGPATRYELPDASSQPAQRPDHPRPDDEAGSGRSAATLH
ncbi:tetratricopeptide repeat protein [Ideonella sp. 4Y16]|uniref:tetratricopeptide repeat protein n=1 Tax=Ideonella alba TaxID=2824118 RepID=UPI001B3863CD|nr:tetratricopeptide repeat protein [Ideonella alba]MBQ0944215.1 tetratricopeptide repeat protein [Ideonella alba]